MTLKRIVGIVASALLVPAAVVVGLAWAGFAVAEITILAVCTVPLSALIVTVVGAAFQRSHRTIAAAEEIQHQHGVPLEDDPYSMQLRTDHIDWTAFDQAHPDLKDPGETR